MKKFWISIAVILPMALSGLAQRNQTINVPPAATTRPALKFRLTFAPEQLSSDNPLPLYELAFKSLQDNERKLDKVLDLIDGDRDADNIAKIRDGLKDLQPLLDLAQKIGKCRDYPAEYPDFSNLASVVDKQFSRSPVKSLINLTLIKAEIEALDGRFNAAFDWIRVSMQITEHTAKPPLLINHLMAQGMLFKTHETLIRIIQMPGSPNLYWPIAQLRRPFLDVAQSIDAELSIIPNCFKDIDDPLAMTADQWQKSFANFISLMNQKQENGPVKTKLGAALYGSLLETAARQAMLKNGFTEKQLEKYEPVQIVGYYVIEMNRASADELRKRIRLPYWQAAGELSAMQKEADQDKNPLDTIQNISISPDIAKKILSAQAKVERNFSMLKNIEALRDFAASHNNTLPKSLDEIKNLHLDADPVTGKEFEWVYKDPKTGVLGSPGESSMKPIIEMLDIEVQVK